MFRVKGKPELPISIVTNIFAGYPLEEALYEIAKMDFKAVEPASIDGNCHHCKVEEMTPENAEILFAKLETLGLKVYGFAGHVNLSTDIGCEHFLTKMRFASWLGAKIINTNAGPLSREKEFRKNMTKVIELAENLNIKVGLESHGDIVSTARRSTNFVKSFAHPLVSMNYDPGNVYYWSRGCVDPSEDILYAADFLEYIHLKDIKEEGGVVSFCPLGEGDCNIPKIVKMLKDFPNLIAVSLEIPISVSGIDYKSLQNSAPLESGVIKSAIERSMLVFEEN